MPQPVTIDFPYTVSTHGSCYLIRSVGFPEFALASSNDRAAVDALCRQAIKTLRGSNGKELINRLIRGTVEHKICDVNIVPPKKSNNWRDAIDVSFDTFTWQQSDALIVTWIPDLQLTVVASPNTEVDQLVKEQVRSSIRRADQWSLPGVAAFDFAEETKLSSRRLTVHLPTAAEFSRSREEKPKSKTPTLSKIATRLRPKNLRPAFHREIEVERLAGTLATDQSRSVLLVGPSGVGKTAIFHQWVRQATKFGMEMTACWATDGSRLISGQTGFGMWQQQCIAMAEEAARYPSIIHLGNLVELCESGRLRGSGGCGSLLAPRLADGDFKAVIECTPQQLSRMSRTEPRLVAALTHLHIEEPTSEQTRDILLEAASTWRPVDITAELKRKQNRKRKKRKRRTETTAEETALPVVKPAALQVLDRLHRRFRTDAAAPGRPLAFFHAVMSQMQGDETLDQQRVIEAFGRQTGLPRFLIDDQVRPDLQSIRRQLRSQVLGQDTVIDTLVDMIATLAADLSRGDRPLASMMLIGPTGVGKTETAKALARLIYSDTSRMVRIDMSELSSPTAVGRLIGDGLHPEGVLTAAVRAQPFSLILLDEFEKAHPSVFDLLLQVLGEGRLTDGHGRLADFRNSIVLMTSNLGVDTFRTNPLGLADSNKEQRYRDHFLRQVREFLRPELFNRIDRILAYDPLGPDIVKRIADLRLASLKDRDGWQSHGESLQISPTAAELLADSGYQPQYGARPLAREIDRSVVVPLAESMCEYGRTKTISAQLDADPQDANTIKVAIDMKPSQLASKAISNRRLIEQATLLRRRGQSLDRCEPVRKLRNEHTLLSRRLKAKIKQIKDPRRRATIRYGREGAICAQLRERLRDVKRLCNELSDAETSVLLKHYRNQRLDFAETEEHLDRLQQRLWNMLCELRSETALDRQQITLVLTGQKLDHATLLIKAYQSLALKRGWTYQIHALLLRDDEQDRKIETPGWSTSPSFRVSAAQLSSEQQQDLESPLLGAYNLIVDDAVNELPPSTVGVMVSFRGEACALVMEDEVGVHTFNRLQHAKSAGTSVLIQKNEGPPINYVAPAWLPLRKFQFTGFPRRWYDADAKMVEDMAGDKPRSIKLDREGKWLQTLIQETVEKKIWAELDEA